MTPTEDWLATRASLRDIEEGETGRPFDEFTKEFRRRNNIGTEHAACLDDIQQGRADLEAGLAQPLAATFDEVRRQFVR